MQPVSFAQPGCVLEFLHNNKPVLAYVVEAQDDKLRLLTVNGRETKLSLSRALPWLGPQHPSTLSRQGILDALKHHQEERERLAQAVDPMEIWEMSEGEVDKAEAAWFAGLLFSTPTADQVAALGRKLLEQRSHFKFQPPHFTILTRDIVEAKLTQAESERQKEELVQAANTIFRDLMSNREGKPETPTLSEDLTDRIKHVLLSIIADPDHPELKPLWDRMRDGLKDDPFLPLTLAQAWGLLPEHYNHHLNRVGYDWGDDWANEHIKEIARIKAEVATERRDPLTIPLVSIDSATTRDIDDAFHVVQTDDGFVITLALSCPVLHWDFASHLARDVAERVTSLYLPEGSSHMLPETLGIDFFSLRQNEDRPALVLSMEISSQGEKISFTPSLAWVRIEKNLTYDSVEADLADPAAPLQPAYALAQALRQQRIQNGAVILAQLDPEVKLTSSPTGLIVDIEDKPPCPKAQLMVSEFMILANSAVAAWAANQRLPLLFRTQDIGLPKKIAGAWDRPEDIYRLMRYLAPAALEASPRPHASLAATAYAPITSPLRRYADFINMAQVVHRLQAGLSLFPREELETMLPRLSARIDAVGQIQRFRPRYWKLLYFKQRCRDQQWPAVLVDDNGPMATLSLPRQQLLVRAPLHLFGEKRIVGQTYSLRLGKIDPLRNEIFVLKAEPSDSE